MEEGLDLFFTYKYTLRFMLSQKLGSCLNTYIVPDISKLVLYFSLRKLEDVDSVEVYNYFYLYRYFFGWKASLTKLKSKFALGKWYYSFDVKLILNKPKAIYGLLFNLFNNTLNKVDESFIRARFFSKELNVFSYSVKDLNAFSESKTNLGLFYLKKPFNMDVFFKGADFNQSVLFLKSMKASGVHKMYGGANCITCGGRAIKTNKIKNNRL